MSSSSQKSAALSDGSAPSAWQNESALKTSTAAQFTGLIATLEETYSDFSAEKELFGAANAVDPQLLASLYFTRAAAALAEEKGATSDVQEHLKRIIAHLEMTEDLMFHGSISNSTADIARAANARSTIRIGAADARGGVDLRPVMQPMSPGVIYGDSEQSPLAPRASAATRGVDGSLPYDLMGVSVTINGRAAPLTAISPSQIKFYEPSGLASGPTEVIVTSQDGFVSRGIVYIASTTPRIMTAGDGSFAAVLSAANGMVGAFNTATLDNLSADKRTRLMIFATGVSHCGTVANTDAGNDLSFGNTVLPNFSESIMVEARTSDGRTYLLPVEFAGAQGEIAGMDQINIVLLSELRGAGAVELTVIAGDQRSNRARIVVS